MNEFYYRMGLRDGLMLKDVIQTMLDALIEYSGIPDDFPEVRKIVEAGITNPKKITRVLTFETEGCRRAYY